ncbi:hypothetical protein RINTHM_2840 [Richelia intracellularis HM01]|uniref:DUF429 domain-containing protein n=1 Tax=Richelia intracellularis TaxID=1164990 RepID=UPI0002B58C9C|nr:DUF429 domain-containing protein [Richelia intracellularis]CCH64760.1 hypothetical protein RINTHM_2840 [Richelia intracellularis HM01]
MKFLGVDFGWKSQPSGLCSLALVHKKLQIIDIDHQELIEDILAWIDEWIPPGKSGIIAVDAPTLIPNVTGSRLPDRLTHKYFGRYHAGCYPANRNLPFAERTIKFGLELEARGFAHAPTIKPRKLGRYQIEVFPHTAIIHFFNLQRILKYKKGPIKERLQELLKLYNYITGILPSLEPALNIQSSSIVKKLGLFSIDFFFSSPTSTELKIVEDKLDSLICAYVAAYWWYWGKDRNLILGDASTGYIISPNRLSN